MIRPLSLVPPSKDQPNHESDNTCSPPLRKRADSLVFSITSEKFFSPKDTMLIESKQHEVSREIETLQLKLENLESRVERIDSEQCQQNSLFSQQNLKRYETGPCPQIYLNDPFGKQNKCCNTTKVGKIVKKEKDLNKTAKLNPSFQRKPKHQYTTNSKHSIASEESELLTKIRELSQLRKEVSAMKNSMEKTQRSKSIFSERLSASKEKIKDLKKEERRQMKAMEKLRADLKKSENIRLKQRQVIQKQQEELNYYREIFKIQKRIR